MGELSNLSILIVDDHELIRRGLHQALQAENARTISEAASLREATAFIATQQFDLIIIDQNLGDGTGMDLATSIALNQPSALSIMLTLDDDWHIIQQAQRSLFSIYINKSCSLKEIIAAINSSLQNPQKFSIYGSVSRESKTRYDSSLTPTEIGILHEIKDGATTREIAVRRYNSEATIKTHLTAIYRKLKVRNRVEAIAEGRRRGIL